MISEAFLEILRCPISHGRLVLVDDRLLQRMNQAIERGEVQNRAGVVRAEQLEGGLINEAREWLFPVAHGIPCLLVDEALAPAQLDSQVTPRDKATQGEGENRE